MTGKSETASEYPTSRVVAMLSSIKRQMISDGAIRVEELHFAGPVPDEGDYPHRARREMENRRHMDLPEFVDGRRERRNGVHEEDRCSRSCR